MKEGIHLGARRRAAASFWLVLWLALVATVVHGALYLRAQRAVSSLAAEIGRESGKDAEPLGFRQAERKVMAQLHAVKASGALLATPPTEVLQLLGSSLPEGVSLVALGFKASSPGRHLLVEAVAARAGDVTELQRRVASSSAVSGTRLLEERRRPDGSLSVRLQVDLAERGVP